MINIKNIDDGFKKELLSYCNDFDKSYGKSYLKPFEKSKKNYELNIGEMQVFLNDILVKKVYDKVSKEKYDSLCDEVQLLLKTMGKENGKSK